VESLLGAVAVVTGAAQGIGKACALAMAEAGSSVVIADIDDDLARAAAEEASARGPACTSFHCDVTRDADFEMLREFILDRYGRVDVVMNNVGALAFGKPELIPVDEWQRILDLNLLALVRSNAVFLPLLIEQGRGHVVNTSSTAGLWSYAWDRTPYMATKAAIVGLSEALALYLRPRGIGVSCFCPGPRAGGSNVSWARHFGERRPAQKLDGFEVVPMERIGGLLVEAILKEEFLVLTDPAVPAILVDRARRPQAFLDHQLERFVVK
jgi:NAD(P)-dependent dehydrogenase (short-subunit alcohol dehydrogenase family)